MLSSCRLKGSVGEAYEGETHFTVPGTYDCLLVGEDLCAQSQRSAAVQLPPRLGGKNGRSICPDQIVLQTLISKWMGTMEHQWDEHLRAAARAGYNMIHFTPLQERGISNSPYSLYNHRVISSDLFGRETVLVPEERLRRLEAKIAWMEEELGLYSMIDVVWNHIACNSELLAQHPEAGYTLQNSPHLRVAYDLDECIMCFSRDLAAGKYDLEADIKSEADVIKVLDGFQKHVLPEAALWEYFVIDVSQAVRELESVFCRSSTPTLSASEPAPKQLEEAIINDGKYGRFSVRMNITLVAAYYYAQLEEYRLALSECERSLILSRVLSEYRSQLDALNYGRYQCYDAKIQQILHNIGNRLIYERVAEHGPKFGPINQEHPLMATYFTRVQCAQTGELIAFANNGWIWNADPLVNFAEATSDAYFTRDVIIWGDCVKLRYGSSPADSPWLWEYMTAYTEEMARIFHGFRIDNCHSTPLPVAEYLLGRARQVRPSLYVCAELFTGNEERDMLFVTRLGLNSLIREAMVAWDPAELARITGKYGGQPTGLPQSRIEFSHGPCVEVISSPSTHHALFMDCTHDNEMPAQRRTPLDALSNAAIVATCTAAIGSVRGYDDIIPARLNVVTNTRLYPLPGAAVTPDTGLWRARQELNCLHQRIVAEGMNAIEVYHADDLIMVERINPHTLRGVLLLARTAFVPGATPLGISEQVQDWLAHIREHFQLGPLLAASIEVHEGVAKAADDRMETLDCKVRVMTRAEISRDDPDLSPLLQGQGSILLYEFGPRDEPVSLDLQEALEIIRRCDLYDLNVLLYRCASEDNDHDPPYGTYNVPGYGDLVYGGLQGFMTVIEQMERAGSGPGIGPLADNIRSGDWLIDYLANRLDRPDHPRLQELSQCLSNAFRPIKALPSLAKPAVVIGAIKRLYSVARETALTPMLKYLPLPSHQSPPSSPASNDAFFTIDLALTSVQLLGRVSSTGLHPSILCPSLSAGLPHFTTHHMRCWGRDVFISLPGLLLRTGRLADARQHLLAFAACCYHGLIPNLLDSARRPRYNARDATWWFLHALQQYIIRHPEHAQGILDEPIPLRFPNDIYVDFDDPTIFTRSKTLKELIQWIMESHARGIHFREWNAGPALDPVMSSNGFNVDITLDPQTGFIYGGNEHNCGTWMDKMGESERAGTRGKPATPRDGAAIEITALLSSTLRWLSSGTVTGQGGVTLSDGTFLTYSEWSRRLETSFEPHYYIPEMEAEDALCVDLRRELIRVRGMYKDTIGSVDLQAPYRLRPNMIVALSLAPWLFSHGRVALATAEAHLMGPLGMRTLAPSDPAYRPHYDNGWDGEDPAIARGFNYHQGPEWCWPLGCYLQATINEWSREGRLPIAQRRILLLRRLLPLMAHLRESPWKGVVELTNQDGAPCRDSCMTQAWSSATLLDALCQMASLGDKDKTNGVLSSSPL